MTMKHNQDDNYDSDGDGDDDDSDDDDGDDDDGDDDDGDDDDDGAKLVTDHGHDGLVTLALVPLVSVDGGLVLPRGQGAGVPRHVVTPPVGLGEGGGQEMFHFEYVVLRMRHNMEMSLLAYITF